MACKRILSTVMLVLLASGCNLFGDKPAIKDIDLGEPFVLFEGQSARLDSATQLTFDALNSDSRCPIGLDCVWAGEVDALFMLKGNTFTDSLKYVGFPSDEGEFLSNENQRTYTIKLLRIDPYPGTKDVNIRAMLQVMQN